MISFFIQNDTYFLDKRYPFKSKIIYNIPFSFCVGKRSLFEQKKVTFWYQNKQKLYFLSLNDTLFIQNDTFFLYKRYLLNQKWYLFPFCMGKRSVFVQKTYFFEIKISKNETFSPKRYLFKWYLFSFWIEKRSFYLFLCSQKGNFSEIKICPSIPLLFKMIFLDKKYRFQSKIITFFYLHGIKVAFCSKKVPFLNQNQQKWYLLFHIPFFIQNFTFFLNERYLFKSKMIRFFFLLG